MKRKHNTWFVIILLMGFLFSETVYADTVAAVTPASQMAADTTVVQKSESAEKVAHYYVGKNSCHCPSAYYCLQPDNGMACVLIGPARRE